MKKKEKKRMLLEFFGMIRAQEFYHVRCVRGFFDDDRQKREELEDYDGLLGREHHLSVIAKGSRQLAN